MVLHRAWLLWSVPPQRAASPLLLHPPLAMFLICLPALRSPSHHSSSRVLPSHQVSFAPRLSLLLSLNYSYSAPFPSHQSYFSAVFFLTLPFPSSPSLSSLSPLPPPFHRSKRSFLSHLSSLPTGFISLTTPILVHSHLFLCTILSVYRTFHFLLSSHLLSSQWLVFCPSLPSHLPSFSLSLFMFSLLLFIDPPHSSNHTSSLPSSSLAPHHPASTPRKSCVAVPFVSLMPTSASPCVHPPRCQ